LKANIGISDEQISRRKQFIVSWKVREKVRENEFCTVVKTMRRWVFQS